MWRDWLEQSQTELFMASEASAVGNDSEQQLTFPLGPIRTRQTPRHLRFHLLCCGEDKLALALSLAKSVFKKEFWLVSLSFSIILGETIIHVHVWWLRYEFLVVFKGFFLAVFYSNQMWVAAYLSSAVFEIKTKEQWPPPLLSVLPFQSKNTNHELINSRRGSGYVLNHLREHISSQVCFSRLERCLLCFQVPPVPLETERFRARTTTFCP